MKKISRFFIAAVLIFAMAACGEKENETPATNNNNNNPSNPDTPTNTIKTGKLRNGNITINGETYNAYGADFNDDGKLEFRINGENPYYYIDYDFVSQNNIVNVEEQWDYIKPLEYGATIDATSRFEGQGDASFSDPQQLPSNFYIGCRVAIGNQIYYGWISVTFNGSEIQWGECAYNSKAGEAIFAGQKTVQR